MLLKNGNRDVPLLPLPKKAKKILVAGSHAHNIGLQYGGWTIELHGSSGNVTVGTTILDAIKSTVDPSTKVVGNFNNRNDLNLVKGITMAQFFPTSVHFQLEHKGLQ